MALGLYRAYLDNLGTTWESKMDTTGTIRDYKLITQDYLGLSRNSARNSARKPPDISPDFPPEIPPDSIGTI